MFINWAPSVAAALVFISALIWNDSVLFAVANDEIQLDNLYSAIFGWSSVQTGFLFAVYGFISSKREGFVQAIQGTEAMGFFNSYLGRAILFGFILTLSSLPLVVYPMKPAAFNFHYYLLSAWFALFVWSFFLFCRVAFEFGIIARVRDNDAKGAG